MSDVEPPDPRVRITGVSAGRGRSPIIGDLTETPVVAPEPPGGREPGDRELSLVERPAPAEEPIVVVVELDSSFPGGLREQQRTFEDVWDAWRQESAESAASKEPITGSLYQCVLTRAGLARLVQRDQDRTTGPPVIRHAWPDYVLYAQVDRSAPTVKVDAARRAFNANGSGIVWAVIDTGIDATHGHFSQLELAREGRVPADQLPRTGGLHQDFSRLVQPNVPFPDGGDSPLTDDVGHGTHVAGIIAGACPEGRSPVVADSMEPVDGGFVRRTNVGPLAGMAQECELVSLKVFRQIQGAAVTSSSAVIAAIEYILREVNTSRQNLRIHGVNLSLGADWDPSHYAAGLSPLCQRIDELSASGVVVVISAGNNGQTLSPQSAKQSVGVLASVTEPGHASSCITVGSTHREAPHVFGVSWTSSKGPDPRRPAQARRRRAGRVDLLRGDRAGPHQRRTHGSRRDQGADVCGTERYQRGRTPRLRRDRRVPLVPAGVHRPARGGQGAADEHGHGSGPRPVRAGSRAGRRHADAGGQLTTERGEAHGRFGRLVLGATVRRAGRHRHRR